VSDRSDEAEWPVRFTGGVVESVTATLGPNDRWNHAALGLHPDGDVPDGQVTARTWGRTRTRRNFEREAQGVVGFTRDPVFFVDAALSIEETNDPVHSDVDATVRASVSRLDEGRDGGTEWVDWRLRPVETRVRRRVVPTVERGFSAVVEATVHASRLDVDAYDTAVLCDRLRFLSSVVDRAGGPRDERAFERIDDHTGWRDR
jgi:hypothetical protein